MKLVWILDFEYMLLLLIGLIFEHEALKLREHL